MAKELGQVENKYSKQYQEKINLLMANIEDLTKQLEISNTKLDEKNKINSVLELDLAKHVG